MSMHHKESHPCQETLKNLELQRVNNEIELWDYNIFINIWNLKRLQEGGKEQVYFIRFLALKLRYVIS